MAAQHPLQPTGLRPDVRGPKSRGVGLKSIGVCQPRPAAELFRWVAY